VVWEVSGGWMGQKTKKTKKIQNKKDKKRIWARWLADPAVEVVWIFSGWLPCKMYGMVKFGEWGVSTDADGLLCKYYYYY